MNRILTQNELECFNIIILRYIAFDFDIEYTNNIHFWIPISLDGDGISYDIGLNFVTIKDTRTNSFKVESAEFFNLEAIQSKEYGREIEIILFLFSYLENSTLVRGVNYTTSSISLVNTNFKLDIVFQDSIYVTITNYKNKIQETARFKDVEKTKNFLKSILMILK